VELGLVAQIEAITDFEAFDTFFWNCHRWGTRRDNTLW
jgi:hypothetical protein